MAQSVGVTVPSGASPVVEKGCELLRRTVNERCGVSVSLRGDGELSIVLEVSPGIGPEGFRIEDGPGGSVRIVGNDERGLLYGIGKFLRTSRYKEDEFTPGTWRGTSVPQKPIRGVYFATHFHNFYHDAPIEKVRRYVEELALWGINALVVWFDMHHYNGIDDPDAQEMLKRLHAILRAGKGAGMRVGIGVLANEAYGNSPKELRAIPPNRAHYNVELCPHLPGAEELLLRWFAEEFNAFSDISLDHLWIWPYDQGGCGCERCKPWGANGFLFIAEKVSRLFRRSFPEAKVILSTWLFDWTEDLGEWEGLARAFETPPDWVDYILAGSHSGFPSYPLERGVPGGLPLLDFPEISMWEMLPWGGFGANPMPQRLQRIWERTGSRLAGGFPYSEGIFEDINKAIVSQFYWQQDKSAADTVREYIAFEYSPEVVEDVARAVEILERNLHHSFWLDASGATRCETNEFAEAEECAGCLRRAETRLTPYAKNSWRWRILLLRALIDLELKSRGGHTGKQCEAAFQELTDIYHAQRAEPCVCPPKVGAVNRPC